MYCVSDAVCVMSSGKGGRTADAERITTVQVSHTCFAGKTHQHRCASYIDDDVLFRNDLCIVLGAELPSVHVLSPQNVRLFVVDTTRVLTK